MESRKNGALSRSENLIIEQKNSCCLRRQNERNTDQKAFMLRFVAKHVHCSENARAAADEREGKECALGCPVLLINSFSLVKSHYYEG